MKPLIHKAFTLVITLISVLQIDAQKEIALKWAPLALAAGKLALGGEIQASKTKSFTIVVGIPVNYHKTFSNDKGNTEINTKTSSLLAGYRLYFSKKGGMKGFYFEPYLKYMHNKLDGEYTDTKKIPPSIYDSKSDFNGGGVGAQLGVQFIIVKTIVFDLFFLGPEANYSKINASFIDVTNNIPWSAQDAEDALNSINDAVKDIPIIGDKIETSVNQNTKTVSAFYKGFIPGIRIGFSIGVRF